MGDKLNDIVIKMLCKDAIEYALSPHLFHDRFKGKEGVKAEIVTYSEFNSEGDE